MIETLEAATAQPLKACTNGPDAIPQQCVKERAISAPGSHHDVAAGQLIKSLIGVRLNRIGERGKLHCASDGNSEQPTDFDRRVPETASVRHRGDDIGILVRGIPGRWSQKHDAENPIEEQRVAQRYALAVAHGTAARGVRNTGRRRCNEAGGKGVPANHAVDVLGRALGRRTAVEQVEYRSAGRVGRIDEHGSGIGRLGPYAGPRRSEPRTMPSAGTSHAVQTSEPVRRTARPDTTQRVQKPSAMETRT